MKTKKFFLMAAMLLMSVCSFAQNNNTPLLGDVNGDGKVDVADIVAILKIMKDAGGTAEKPTYYWYVGQTDPSTMTSISPIVTDNSSPGWRLIGTNIPTYTFENPLYNAEDNPIVSNPSRNDYWYVALPVNSSLSVYDSVDRNEVTNGNWTKESSTITINNVSYNIYKSVGTYRKFNVWWIH